MNARKILTEEIADLKISSLPTRPTSPVSYGGRGYTSSEMKNAFDRLSLFIIERFNALLDDISSTGDGSLADEIPTGISDGHSLSDLFSDVTNGNFASYLHVDGVSLATAIAEIKAALGLISSTSEMEAGSNE